MGLGDLAQLGGRFIGARSRQRQNANSLGLVDISGFGDIRPTSLRFGADALQSGLTPFDANVEGLPGLARFLTEQRTEGREARRLGQLQQINPIQRLQERQEEVGIEPTEFLDLGGDFGRTGFQLGEGGELQPLIREEAVFRIKDPATNSFDVLSEEELLQSFSGDDKALRDFLQQNKQNIDIVGRPRQAPELSEEQQQSLIQKLTDARTKRDTELSDIEESLQRLQELRDAGFSGPQLSQELVKFQDRRRATRRSEELGTELRGLKRRQSVVDSFGKLRFNIEKDEDLNAVEKAVSLNNLLKSTPKDFRKDIVENFDLPEEWLTEDGRVVPVKTGAVAQDGFKPPTDVGQRRATVADAEVLIRTAGVEGLVNEAVKQLQDTGVDADKFLDELTSKEEVTPLKIALEAAFPILSIKRGAETLARRAEDIPEFFVDNLRDRRGTGIQNLTPKGTDLGKRVSDVLSNIEDKLGRNLDPSEKQALLILIKDRIQAR